jgi:hypothetical protein
LLESYITKVYDDATRIARVANPSRNKGSWEGACLRNIQLKLQKIEKNFWGSDTLRSSKNFTHRHHHANTACLPTPNVLQTISWVPLLKVNVILPTTKHAPYNHNIVDRRDASLMSQTIWLRLGPMTIYYFYKWTVYFVLWKCTNNEPVSSQKGRMKDHFEAVWLLATHEALRATHHRNRLIKAFP